MESRADESIAQIAHRRPRRTCSNHVIRRADQGEPTILNGKCKLPWPTLPRSTRKDLPRPNDVFHRASHASRLSKTVKLPA